MWQRKQFYDETWKYWLIFFLCWEDVSIFSEHMLVNLQRFPWKLLHFSYIIQRYPPARVLGIFHFHAVLIARSSYRWSNLVSGTLEVLGEGNDDWGGVSGNLGLAVDAENDGGLGGDDGNTVTTLATYISTLPESIIWESKPVSWKHTARA